jgi:uncharacterized cupin superfamily protein
VFKPREAHQIANAGEVDLVYYVVADNPAGEWCHYPDSDKFNLRSEPKQRCVRVEGADYFEGEE